jgi:YggT family protein
MMGGGPLSDAGLFLVNTLFSLYIGAVLLRLVLQWSRADFYNPISQAIVRITSPVLRPLRRFIPSIGRLDTASFVLIFALQWLNLWLTARLFGVAPGIATMTVMVAAELIRKLVYLYMFAIFVLALASWIANGGANPALRLLDSIAEPLLAPIRRWLPNLGGLDLSPLVALVLLQLALKLIVAPLTGFGVSL